MSVGGRLQVEVEPRSIYRMSGEARWGVQRAVLPTPALRHSITFRTRRRERCPSLPAIVDTAGAAFADRQARSDD